MVRHLLLFVLFSFRHGFFVLLPGHAETVILFSPIRSFSLAAMEGSGHFMLVGGDRQGGGNFSFEGIILLNL